MVFTRLKRVRIYVLSFARAKVNKNKAATEAIPYLRVVRSISNIYLLTLQNVRYRWHYID